jgi:hypothetical protein
VRLFLEPGAAVLAAEPFDGVDEALDFVICHAPRLASRNR